MIPLIDADILRYEIGYAAEAGVKAIRDDPDALPSFDYVEELLLLRLQQISLAVEATQPARLFYTEGQTFRFDLAQSRPYKGTRGDLKPWHFDNLTVYMRDVLGAQPVSYMEADDMLAVEHVGNPAPTCLVSRDKDLRQVPGMYYSWELGRQPEFGPVLVTKEGTLELKNGKLVGTGLAFFYSQLLTGDTVDNIPGIIGLGPAKAYRLLEGCETPKDYFDAIVEAYKDHKGDAWEDYLLEQGRLLWMTRSLDAQGNPVLWEPGMEE